MAQLCISWGYVYNSFLLAAQREEEKKLQRELFLKDRVILIYSLLDLKIYGLLLCDDHMLHEMIGENSIDRKLFRE